jgi:hypothetical protein
MESLKALDYTSKTQVEQFIASGTWKFVVETIKQAIEMYREQLETVVSIDDLRVTQGRLSCLHELLSLPDKITEQLTEEMENVERERADNQPVA